MKTKTELALARKRLANLALRLKTIARKRINERRELVRIVAKQPFAAAHCAIGFMRAVHLSAEPKKYIWFEEFATEVAAIRSAMRNTLATNNPKLLAKIMRRDLPDSKARKPRRGRPAKKDYQLLARQLLFRVADLRSQPQETPWGFGEKSDPGRIAPGPFDAVAAKCRQLLQYDPSSPSSFAAWYDCALELLLVMESNPTSDQWADHHALVRRILGINPLTPENERLLPMLPTKDPTVVSRALKEALSWRPFSLIPVHPKGSNPVAKFMANKVAIPRTKGRLIAQKRARMNSGDGIPPTDDQVEAAIPQLDDLKESIAVSQRRATLKKVCKEEWPKFWKKVKTELQRSGHTSFQI